MTTLSKQRAILIEFNELCPHLLDQWMKRGLLPNFSIFFEQADVFVTEADVTEPVNLEPWIQWYSLHTGLAYDQHRVFNLTDGPKRGHVDIFQILADHGKAVWNCSSMNVKGLARSGSAFLPDPWCTSERPYPEEMRAFHRIVSWYVQEYTNRDKRLGLNDYLGFAAFMATHGLSARTAFTIAKQLLSEAMTRKDTYWKRAALMDQLLFDVFRHYFKKMRPDFATFFCNSTAHFQHAYWRHMEPDMFAVKPSPSALARYGDAILFGYQQMDRLLGNFFKLEGSDVMLIFATALSQQPNLKSEAIGGQHFYRPRDVEELLRTLNIRHTGVTPVMTHQYLIHFPDSTAKQEAFSALNGLTWNGEQVFGFGSAEGDSIYFGIQIKISVPPDARLLLGGPDQSIPFYDIFYMLEEIKSGRHHPDGALWFKTGRHQMHKRVSILDVYPTLLDFFGIPPESSSTGARMGKSLLPALASVQAQAAAG